MEYNDSVGSLIDWVKNGIKGHIKDYIKNRIDFKELEFRLKEYIAHQEKVNKELS